jgi:hypothetical protein
VARVRDSQRRLKCDHSVERVTVIFTELGCHARCLRCLSVGSGRPSSQVARWALLSGARTLERGVGRSKERWRGGQQGD